MGVDQLGCLKGTGCECGESVCGGWARGPVPTGTHWYPPVPAGTVTPVGSNLPTKRDT